MEQIGVRWVWSPKWSLSPLNLDEIWNHKLLPKSRHFRFIFEGWWKSCSIHPDWTRCKFEVGIVLLPTIYHFVEHGSFCKIPWDGLYNYIYSIYIYIYLPPKHLFRMICILFHGGYCWICWMILKGRFPSHPGNLWSSSFWSPANAIMRSSERIELPGDADLILKRGTKERLKNEDEQNFIEDTRISFGMCISFEKYYTLIGTFFFRRY